MHEQHRATPDAKTAQLRANFRFAPFHSQSLLQLPNFANPALGALADISTCNAAKHRTAGFCANSVQPRVFTELRISADFI
jgi:hypothetical protein